MGIRVVAFDCDGVMFDTTRANEAYYNQILAHFGLAQMTPEQFRYAHMHTADKAISLLFEDPKRIDDAHNYRKSMGYDKFFRLMEMEPYLIPLLKTIRPGIKTAVATNRTDTITKLLAEFDLDQHFDLVVSANDVNYPKPHPDILIRVLQYFNVQPDEVLYIGDSEVDAQAADAARIPLAAYRNNTLSAAYHISGLIEIQSILAENFYRSQGNIN